jgi:class 3 adenylate cyclase
VFSSAASAGEAALAIRDHVSKSLFYPSGQEGPLGLRIGMHGGPVYAVEDPISNHATLLGSHINRAARIEPITEGGQVFVSQEFAALAAAETVTSFRCVPQGVADLPKAGGRIPVYRLERTI